jgi:GH15 family glucan-1,4-alpha-glucosidase
MASRIEDYALIGDCETAALVSRDGSVDWLCWPRFDSDACFAALLGEPKHGHWHIGPKSQARITRQYRDNTLILETRFETADGAITLVDFMPPRNEESDLVRLVIGERGRVPMRLELILRFGYGATVPWVARTEDGTWRAIAGPDMVTLRTPVNLVGENFTTTAEFIVTEGQTIPFVLGYSPSNHPIPPILDAKAALQETESFWRDWAKTCRPAGEWSEAVMRSLITLKALTYAPTGGIVAAPTTSLPEMIGGPRNWDYRFCWLRDAKLTLAALTNAGYVSEAQAWRAWLLRAVAGSPDQLQIMYGIAGERRLTEWETPWLSGYENSRPVRIGNAAHEQLQLDVFGELLGAFHHGRTCGLAATSSGWALEVAVLDHLAKIWKKPDQGIWEMRGDPQHFTYSKAMAWLAFDRATLSAETFGLDGPVDRWRSLRAEIHDDVCTHGFDPELGSFVQAYGSKQLDATLLLLPIIGFLPIDDKRIAGTVRAIENDLVSDGFVLRYRTEAAADGLPKGEGAFLACSFWLADVYMKQRRWSDARRQFSQLLSLRNDVGLLSEEYDPRLGRQVGNFPQAFSHLALVNSAYGFMSEAPPHPTKPDPTKQ